MSGMIYEPRSLWQVFRTGVSTSENTVMSYDEYWANEWKYPVEIRELALCPVGYSFVEDASIIGGIKIRQVSRFRRSMTRSIQPASLLAQANTAEPGRGLQAAFNGHPWGVVYKQFAADRPLRFPRDAALQMALSNPILGDDLMTYSVAFEETGMAMGGAMRRFNGSFFAPSSIAYPFTFWGVPGTPGQPISGAILDATFPTIGWSPVNIFDAHEFKTQDAGRNGVVNGRGMSVMIDQAGFDSLTVGGRMPASTTVGSKMAITGGGTGDRWWRDGAPLALTFSTITPAIVYRLEEPIILAPGDTLQFEINIPPVINVNIVSVQFGLAANGYALCEG